MIRFAFRNNQLQFVEAEDHEQLKLCPQCTLPNHENARVCVDSDCRYFFGAEANEWLEATEIVQCESCGAYMSRGAAVCPECGTQFGHTADNIPGETPLRSEFYVCPKCGRRNPPSVDVCQNPDCGASLEDVDLTLEVISQNGDPESSVLDLCVTIENAKTREKTTAAVKPDAYLLIGREEMLGAQLENCEYVSRLHCLVGAIGDSLYLVDLSSGGTYIAREQLPRGRKVPIKSGTMVFLGAPSLTDDNSAAFVFTY